jgi:hypothetical protein
MQGHEYSMLMMLGNIIAAQTAPNKWLATFFLGTSVAWAALAAVEKYVTQ